MGTTHSAPKAVTVETTALPPGQQVAAVAAASPETGPPTTLSSTAVPVAIQALQAVDAGRPSTYDIPRTAWPYTVHERTSPDATKLGSGVTLIQGGITDRDTAEGMCDQNSSCLYYVYKPATKTYDVFSVAGKTAADLDAAWMPEGSRSDGDPATTYVKDN